MIKDVIMREIRRQGEEECRHLTFRESERPPRNYEVAAFFGLINETTPGNLHRDHPCGFHQEKMRDG
jgi:hypothetical protein